MGFRSCGLNGQLMFHAIGRDRAEKTWAQHTTLLYADLPPGSLRDSAVHQRFPSRVTVVYQLGDKAFFDIG